MPRFGRVPGAPRELRARRRNAGPPPQRGLAAGLRRGPRLSGGPPPRRCCCPWPAKLRAISAGRAPAAAGPPSRRTPTAAAAPGAPGPCPGCRRRDVPCSTSRPCARWLLAAGRAECQPAALPPGRPRHTAASRLVHAARAPHVRNREPPKQVSTPGPKPISPRENLNFEFLSLIMLAVRYESPQSCLGVMASRSVAFLVLTFRLRLLSYFF